MEGIPDFRKVLDEALAKLGRLNIVAAGKTGVGKSTLINAVFQGELASTGQGRPVTAHTTLITKEGIPLGIFDTRGLEVAGYRETIGGLERLIRDRDALPDPNEHVHVAWVCLVEDSHRVETAEIELVDMLTQRNIPVVVVITKAKADEGFADTVRRLLPQARNVVRVRAKETILDDGHYLPPMGLDTLIDVTNEVVPEGQRNALAAAQRVNLRQKVARSRAAMGATVTAVAGVALAPIPFADAAVIVPLQVTMLATISAIWGLPVSRAFLGTLLGGAVAGAGGVAAGRATVAGLLKLVPGAGSLVGGLISGATAAALTTAFGEAYIAALSLVARDPQHPPSVEEIRRHFVQELRKRRISPPPRNQ